MMLRELLNGWKEMKLHEEMDETRGRKSIKSM